MSRVSVYDYQMINFREDSHTSFKIINGPYSGTIITYGRVGLTEPTSGDIDEAKLSFEYTIEETPLKESEIDTSDLHEYLGDMLIRIIEESLERKAKIGKMNANDNS